MVDDGLDLGVGVRLEDDGFELPPGLELAVELDGEVDDVGDEDEDEFGAHVEPLQHVVQEVLLVYHVVDLVQHDYLRLLLVAHPLPQAHLQPLARLHLLPPLPPIELLKDEVVNQVHSPSRHAVQVGNLHRPRVSLKELKHLSNQGSLPAPCVSMQAKR